MNQKVVDCEILVGPASSIETQIKDKLKAGWQLNGQLLPHKEHGIYVQSVVLYQSEQILPVPPPSPPKRYLPDSGC